MQPLSGNQRPDLLTCLVNMSLVLRLPREMHLCRSSSNAPRLPTLCKTFMFCSLLTRRTIREPATQNDASTSKSGPSMWCFNIFTCKCASRHIPVHFLSISTSKSSPNPLFLKFWLRNAFRATMAFTFSTSQLPKVVRTWCILRILTFEMCFTPQRRKIVHLSSGQMAPHPPL